MNFSHVHRCRLRTFQALVGIALTLLCVQAQAVKSCSVSANIAFGAYDPLASADLSTIGSVDFYCNGNTSVTLKLGIGNGTGASFYSGRRMTANSGNQLLYNIYTDSTRTRVLGDGTDGSYTLAITGKFGFSKSVYGVIPAHQRGLSAASYSDMLVITIVY